MTNIDANILVMNNKLEMVNKARCLSLLNCSMKVYFSMNKKIFHMIFLINTIIFGSFFYRW